MTLWLKIVIILLALHYVFAIAVLFLVLKDNLKTGGKTKRVPLICWNLTVLLLPILGPILYLIYRTFANSKAKQASTEPTFAPTDRQNTPSVDNDKTDISTDSIQDASNIHIENTNTSPKSEDK